MSFVDTLARIPKILEANINEIIDKCEDPGKMVEQQLIDCKRELADVKRDTVEVMADFEIATKDLEAAEARVTKVDTAVKAAVRKGNDEDAKILLTQKNNLEQALADYRKTYEIRKQNAEQMRQAYQKLVNDIELLEVRKDAIKGKVKLANAKSTVNKTKMRVGTDKVTNAFAKWEKKADRMLAKADAEEKLDDEIQTAEDLTEKYAGAGSFDADAELAKVKKELGI